MDFSTPTDNSLKKVNEDAFSRNNQKRYHSVLNEPKQDNRGISKIKVLAGALTIAAVAIASNYNVNKKIDNSLQNLQVVQKLQQHNNKIQKQLSELGINTSSINR